MEFITEWFAWLKTNYIGIFAVLVPIYTIAESITRLTPTKTDDSVLERIGKVGRRVMDILKIPNVKRTDEKGVDGTHEPRPQEPEKIR